MTTPTIPLAREIGRVPSSRVPLDAAQELRFQRLADSAVMIDVHQHPMILPEDVSRLTEYLRANIYGWGYEAVRQGGWTAVTTANMFRCLVNNPDMSFAEFDDILTEVGLMLSDVDRQEDVVKVTNADEIQAARQQGKIGFMPTLEHLAIGNDINRLDILYSAGVRLAGLTYNRKNYIGDGQQERNPGGLSEFGVSVVRRMNQLGMCIDVSHASIPTAMDAIEFSEAPITFSHNASYTLRPTTRTRRDEELVACARKGGLVAITAVPNSLSDDPRQDINCVLDHYDYMVDLVGVDHVAIGTDTNVGDHVDFHHYVLNRSYEELPAPYLDGLESPADGQNIIRGLVSRGHSDEDILKIVGGNALDFFRRVMG